MNDLFTIDLAKTNYSWDKNLNVITVDIGAMHFDVLAKKDVILLRSPKTRKTAQFEKHGRFRNEEVDFISDIIPGDHTWNLIVTFKKVYEK